MEFIHYERAWHIPNLCWIMILGICRHVAGFSLACVEERIHGDVNVMLCVTMYMCIYRVIEKKIYVGFRTSDSRTTAFSLSLILINCTSP